MTKRFRYAALAVPMLFVFCPAASADETLLPGVDAGAGDAVTGARTMAPVAGEPEGDAREGWVRVGDWDVKVSGNVTIDIGTRPPPRNGR